jgi:hypothetical protein
MLEMAVADVEFLLLRSDFFSDASPLSSDMVLVGELGEGGEFP